MRTARHLLAFTFLVGLTSIGCSGGLSLIPVSGKVTMNGKPIKNVKVDFHPDPDMKTTGPGSSGTTNENGEFTLICNKGSKPGAVPGHHRVVLEDLDVFGTVFVGRGDYRAEDDEKKTKEVPIKPRFNKKYSELPNTPFKQEVKAGMGSVLIEIK